MIRKTIAVAAALMAAAPAFAGRLMLGPAQLMPSYGFETRYEDNIYRVPRDENGTAVAGGGVRGSWIFQNDLGLALTAPVAHNQKLDLGYMASFQNYTTQQKANNAINQNANASWAYDGSKTLAKVYDNYVNTHDPQFNPNGNIVNGALVTREARWGNTAGGFAEYRLGDKFFAGVDASNIQNRYLNRAGGAASLANLLNTSADVFGAKAGYAVGPKTRVYGAVHRTLLHYTEHTRQDNHRDTTVDLGVEGDLTPKLRGVIQGGYVYQGYDFDPANPDRKTVARNGSFLASLDFKPNETCSFTLTGTRSNNDAASAGARYTVSTGGNLAYTHKFTEKVSAGLNTGVQVDSYSENFVIGGENKTRRDDTYQVGARLDYQVYEWLKTGASFTNVDRYSTFSRQFNYRDNVSAVNLRVAF